MDWSWKTPGLSIRRHQFNDYSLLITGDPGKGDYWGLRYEGHHLSINLTFMRDELGKLSVAGTPLFRGFPNGGSPIPFDPEQADNPLGMDSRPVDAFWGCSSFTSILVIYGRLTAWTRSYSGRKV